MRHYYKEANVKGLFLKFVLNKVKHRKTNSKTALLIFKFGNLKVPCSNPFGI
jgi:hypothetical protein